MILNDLYQSKLRADEVAYYFNATYDAAFRADSEHADQCRASAIRHLEKLAALIGYRLAPLEKEPKA